MSLVRDLQKLQSDTIKRKEEKAKLEKALEFNCTNWAKEVEVSKSFREKNIKLEKELDQAHSDKDTLQKKIKS